MVNRNDILVVLASSEIDPPFMMAVSAFLGAGSMQPHRAATAVVIVGEEILAINGSILPTVDQIPRTDIEYSVPLFAQTILAHGAHGTHVAAGAAGHVVT